MIYYRTNDRQEAKTVRNSRADLRPEDGPWHVWYVVWAPDDTESVVTQGVDSFDAVMDMLGRDVEYSVAWIA